MKRYYNILIIYLFIYFEDEVNIQPVHVRTDLIWHFYQVQKCVFLF